MISPALAKRRLAPPKEIIKSGSARLASLDGLRGVAAVVVVIHHLYLVAEPVLRRDGGAGFGSALWWVSETPLKLLTAGSEAVLVFFVLSGLVVSLPMLRTNNFSWSAFLTGRLARLYLPAWASIALGTLCIWLIPRSHSAVGKGTWMDVSQATSISWSTIITDASLTRVSYSMNNVLWSLRWELVFSVLLPIFLAVAIATARRCTITIIVMIGLSTVGTVTGIDGLRYLPLFFIGTAIAVRLDEIRSWMRSRTRRPHSTIWAITFVSVSLVLLICQWLLRPIVPAHSLTSTLLAQLSVLGATGLVLVAIGVPAARRMLETPALQWLGKVSFSLYLIHMPILATLAFLFGQDRWWLVALVTVPAALLAAWGFNRAVEKPSHRLARLISSSISTQLDAHRAQRLGADIAAK